MTVGQLNCAFVACLVFTGCSRPSSPSLVRETSTEVVTNVEEPNEATPDRLVEEPQASVADTSDLIPPTGPSTPVTAVQQTAAELLQQRQGLDETLWAPEVAAQRHEEPFVRLWDQLRERTDKFTVAKAFQFDTIRFASSGDAKEIGLDIRLTALNANKVSLDQQGWQSLLDKIESVGYRIAQSEWHHASFDPNDPAGPHSLVTFVIDLARDQPASRVSIR